MAAVGSVGNTSRDGLAHAKRRACRGFAAMEDMVIVRARGREWGGTLPGVLEVALRRAVCASGSLSDTRYAGRTRGRGLGGARVGRIRLNIRPPPEARTPNRGWRIVRVQRTTRLPASSARNIDTNPTAERLRQPCRRTVLVFSSVRRFRLFTISNIMLYECRVVVRMNDVISFNRRPHTLSPHQRVILAPEIEWWWPFESR